MAVREGKWRCPHCADVNRGADLACRGCGATRDEHVAFFLEDDAPEVTDEALLARARSGADWLCEYCATSNTPDHAACRQCGAERGGAASRVVREIADAPAPVAAARPASPLPRAIKILLALVVLLLAGFCWHSLRKTQATLQVAGFEWRRSIDVEALVPVHESAWEGSVPGDARITGRSREVHHVDRIQTGSRRVRVGKKDLGNGFFEDVYRDEPVYADRPVYGTKVSYDVLRWVRARAPTATGNDRAPAWPALALGSGERAAARRETYVVVLKGDTTYRMELPEARWSQLAPGQRVHAVIQGGSRVLSIE